MPTTTSKFPEKLRKHYECILLHKKKPIWNGEYLEFEGKSYKKIEWECAVCNGKMF